MTSPGTTTHSGYQPDDINWKDNGCDLNPACLSCPLPRCIEEEPRGKQKLRMLARASHMAQLKRQGKSTREIAALFNISQRTVQRVLAAGESPGENKEKRC